MLLTPFPKNPIGSSVGGSDGEFFEKNNLCTTPRTKRKTPLLFLPSKDIDFTSSHEESSFQGLGPWVAS